MGPTPILCRKTGRTAPPTPKPPPARPRRQLHGANGAALHPQQSRRQHHHSRDAQAPQRRSQHRRQRPRPPPDGPAQTAPRPPLGPQPNKLEPINEVLSFSFSYLVLS